MMMKTNKLPLAAVKANPNNPRTISPENERLLVKSILEFPKMLEIRPVVTDREGVILGGNMRHKALSAIAAMSEKQIVAGIAALRSSQSKTPEEVDNLTSFWVEWLKAPFAFVVDASNLTEDEKRAFVIKDNVNFGHWEFDMLDNFSQEDMKSLCEELGMRFYVSDAHFKELSCNGSCCGLPPDWNYSRGQWCEALQIAKRKGRVLWEDVRSDIEQLVGGFDWGCARGYNCNTSEKRAKFEGMTMADYMKWLWNNPQRGQSPYKLFEGALVPHGKDADGNIIYIYNGAEF